MVRRGRTLLMAAPCRQRPGPIVDRHIRHIVAQPEWDKQRRLWQQISARKKA